MELGKRVSSLFGAHREIEAAEESKNTGGDQAYQNFNEDLQVTEDNKNAHHPPILFNFVGKVTAISAFYLKKLNCCINNNCSISTCVETDASKSGNGRVTHRVLTEVGRGADDEVPQHEKDVINADGASCPIEIV